MTEDELIKKIIEYVKDNQPCRFSRDLNPLPEQFKGVDETFFDECLLKAINNGLLKGLHASNRFSNIRLP